MSSIILSELRAIDLFQEITIGDRPLDVVTIRPRLFKHLAPAGTVQILVKDSSGSTTLASSNSVTITAISAQNFFHGMIQFDVDFKFGKNTTYRIVLTSSGYTFGASAFVGLVQGYDSHDVAPLSYAAPNTATEAPYQIELWEFKNQAKGVRT